MENTHKLYEEFIHCLRGKIPQNSALVKMITDILPIEKAAVYRRLRGDVPFTFSEIATICNTMEISLDRLINTPHEMDKLFQMERNNFYNLSNADYRWLENYNETLKSVKNVSNTEFAECSVILPPSLYLNFRNLTRYYLFKWGYQNKHEQMKPFCEVEISKRLAKIYKDFLYHTKHISFTVFLWDHLIFQNLVTEIKYFNEINLISRSETALIKEELFSLLNHVWDLCIKGGYEETGNYVCIYISDIYHETICSYLEASEVKLSLFKFFTLNYITSTDAEVFDILKKWIKSLLRTSTAISISNEMERNSFFHKQYNIINSL